MIGASRGWSVWLVASLVIVTLAAMLEFRPPAQIVIPGLDWPLPQTCSLRRVLGVPCPGCGLTRSFVLAADGRVREALAIHPWGTLLFGLVLLQIPLRLAEGLWIGLGHSHASRCSPVTIATITAAVTLLVGMALSWIVRMVV